MGFAGGQRTLVRMAGDPTASPKVMETLRKGDVLWGGAVVSGVTKVLHHEVLQFNRVGFGPLIECTSDQKWSFNKNGKSTLRSYDEGLIDCRVEAFKPPDDTPIHYDISMILVRSSTVSYCVSTTNGKPFYVCIAEPSGVWLKAS